jgi:hypothetical protein
MIENRYMGVGQAYASGEGRGGKRGFPFARDVDPPGWIERPLSKG